MGTAHGAEELGLCSHGLACQAGAEKSKIKTVGKNILRDP
jgi:hypothetical protein